LEFREGYTNSEKIPTFTELQKSTSANTLIYVLVYVAYE
jgi:hypothetical protein